MFTFITFPEMLRAKADLAAQKGESQTAAQFARLAAQYAK